MEFDTENLGHVWIRPVLGGDFLREKSSHLHFNRMAKSHYLHYVTSNNSPIVVILSISMINEGSKFDPLGIFSLLKTMKGTISYLGGHKSQKK